MSAVISRVAAVVVAVVVVGTFVPWSATFDGSVITQHTAWTTGAR